MNPKSIPFTYKTSSLKNKPKIKKIDTINTEIILE